MTLRADTITVGKEGEEEREEEKKKTKEQVKYDIIPNGRSLSFFHDAEIQLDLQQEQWQ